ncbi:hypothetical protein [Actinomycetospora termitidis]|uniref:Uncharacterized protein n=1 Tax=Actinomycetospora termitidis TaxID=3053470 RepID=A0ABT7M706_9PSEU|nr:hypothetical protein [Actinomycetospora sp. Odt1-22]MDL5156456.1 hypothetical protein [Actinomycetospora sp. Odt1-22]
MRAVGMIVLLATVVLFAAGCGSPGGGGGGDTPPGTPPTVPTGAPPGGTSTPPVPVDPLVADPPPGGTALDPARVTTTGLPAGFPTLVWSRGPRTLGVYGRSGGCTEAAATVVDQTPEAVTVRVTQTTTSTGPCTRELRYPAFELPLTADLGQRRVVLTGEQN